MIGWILLGAVVAVVGIAGWKTSRAAYESAPYTVVRAAGDFEVRDYPALTVVETPGDRSEAGANGSFMRLFRFITGGNTAHQEIAMTTPVLMAEGASDATMAFVMPATLKAGDIPAPADGSLKVRELPAGRFVVLRFSGRRTADNEAAALSRLKSWMEAGRFGLHSSPVFAYFDPPWTPGFLRRNEVMIRTDAGRP